MEETNTTRSDDGPPHGLGAEDWWAVWIGGALLAAALAIVLANGDMATGDAPNSLAGWLAKPGSWNDNPAKAFFAKDRSILPGLVRVFVLCLVVFGIGAWGLGVAPLRFAAAFGVLFALAVLAYLLAGQEVIKHYNLEYVLWALFVGLLISNTTGTPKFLLAAARTEFYIKTGLVLLGAEVLFNRLLVLGLPGVFVAWLVTPIVLMTTFWFGQRVLRMESPSLNMVISADMSVCGVSAAIATAAACRAKREELSLAIGLSLFFTVIMMVAMPPVIRALGMSEVLGGAWIGGTIDATGAVAAAGAMLGDTALQTAATVKMIQNILIGVVAFAVAVYWVTCVERPGSSPLPVEPSGDHSRGSTLRVEPAGSSCTRHGDFSGGEIDAMSGPKARLGESSYGTGGATEGRTGVGEIWRRLPKFILGFVAASIAFSVLQGLLPRGERVVDAVINGGTKVLREWFFCLAFVSIGLETNVRQLARYLKDGKAVVLYVAGQSLNLVLTLAMAWLMFEKVFPGAAEVLRK